MKTCFYRSVKKTSGTRFSKTSGSHMFPVENRCLQKPCSRDFLAMLIITFYFCYMAVRKTHSEYFSAKQPHHYFFNFFRKSDLFFRKKSVFSLKFFSFSKVTPSKSSKKHSDNIETLKSCMLSNYLKEKKFFQNLLFSQIFCVFTNNFFSVTDIKKFMGTKNLERVVLHHMRYFSVVCSSVFHL